MWGKNLFHIATSPHRHIPFLLIVLMIGYPLHASELEETKKNMEQSKARQEELAEQTRKLETEQKTLQKKLVASARAVQKSEAGMTAAEEKLRILNDQMQARGGTLSGQRKRLAALVQASLRLSQTPPEAMIMMPGDPTQTLQAARALNMAASAIRKETEALGLQMADLEKLKEKVSDRRKAARQQQADLDQERRELESQLARRHSLQAALGQQQQEEAEKLAQLARKAEDLQGLMTTITTRKGKKLSVASDRRAPEGDRGKLRPFASAKGRIRTPVAGQVTRMFGDTEGPNATSKGLVISARSGAQVTSPYDGEVLFTGPFLNYGPLVIVRHSDDFHTLLAGLAKIDVEAGQFLLEGEPIGAMGDSQPGNPLYVELRKQNQPVDPAPWINGLDKRQ